MSEQERYKPLAHCERCEAYDDKHDMWCIAGKWYHDHCLPWVDPDDEARAAIEARCKHYYVNDDPITDIRTLLAALRRAVERLTRIAAVDHVGKDEAFDTCNGDRYEMSGRPSPPAGRGGEWMSERSQNEQCEKCGRGFDKVRRLVDWIFEGDDIYLCVSDSKKLEKIMRDWLKR